MSSPDSSPKPFDHPRGHLELVKPPEGIVTIQVFIYNKEGAEPLNIESCGRLLVGETKVFWVFWQEEITSALSLPFNYPIEAGYFQMYHPERKEWLSLPEPRRPILVEPDVPLLWRRTGLEELPKLRTHLLLASSPAQVFPDIPDLPATPSRPLLGPKPIGLKAAIGLLADSPSTPTRKGTKVARMRPRRPASSTNPSTPGRARSSPSVQDRNSTLVPSTTSENQDHSSPLMESSSPPAPSQLLRDVWGTDRKIGNSISSSGAGPSTLKPSASTVTHDSAKRPRAGSPESLPSAKRSRLSTPGTLRARKGKGPLTVDIDLTLTSDEDHAVQPVKKSKGKRRAGVPVPPDAEVIDLTDD